MQQITRKVSCSYTMQNKQKWTRKRNLNTLPRPLLLFPSLLVSFVRISALRGRGPVDPKIPLTPETITTRGTRAREFCLTFSVFMLSRLCSWHHFCGPHCMYVWFLTMQLQHTRRGRREWFWVLEIALELQPTHFSLLTQFSIYAFYFYFKCSFILFSSSYFVFLFLLLALSNLYANCALILLEYVLFCFGFCAL